MSHLLIELTPLFIAFIFTLPIVFFIPKTEKYEVAEIGRFGLVQLTDSYIKHSDINTDGETEILYSGNNQRGNHSIIILHPDGKLLNQWNFSGAAPNEGERFFVGDADGNGFNEVYVFAQVKDSIFLNYFEPYNPDAVVVRNVFIDIVNETDGGVDFNIKSTQLCSLGDEDAKSLLFGISAGFSLQPRKIYLYDPISRTVKKSPTSGATFRPISCYNANNSYEPIIFSRTFATGNMRSNTQIPFPDWSAWLMVFDKNLNFLFSPIEFEGFNRIVQTYPFYLKDELKILVHTSSNARCDTCQLLLLYSLEGNELLRKRLFDHPDGTFVLFEQLSALKKPPLLFSPETGNLFEVGNSLDLEFRAKVPVLGRLTSDIKGLDFKDDEIPDFFVLGFSNGLVFLNERLKPVATHIMDDFDPLFNYTVSVKKRDGQNDKKISFQVGNNQVVLSLYPNPLHYLKWLILLGYFLGIAAIVHISQKIYQYRFNRSQKLEKELLGLQTQLATNQLDPHFVSNALNSISACVLLNKNLEAFEYIVKFSTLVQETLKSSDHTTRSLDEELGFVRNFLDLEKKRKGNFDYQVVIGSKVDLKTQVPKMAIQIFAENAVKHGFNDADKKGELLIDVSKTKSVLEITIKDNGAGMRKAFEPDVYSTKKGISTIEKIFALHRKLFNRKISYEIKNLTPKNDGQTGTEVRIRLEVNGQD